MRSRQRMVAGVVFLVVSAGALLGQAGSREADAILAADAAWLKVYQAKDLAKSAAFCDEQALCWLPTLPSRLERMPLRN
jgi:hypothetical protein